jgi:hypothetical protein
MVAEPADIGVMTPVVASIEATLVLLEDHTPWSLAFGAMNTDDPFEHIDHRSKFLQ